MELGIEWTQKKISVMEGKEKIDADILKQVAQILKVPMEAIENFNEEQAINIIANTFDNESVAYVNNYKCTINPMDKWLEALEEIKLLHQENPVWRKYVA
jgi:hypothetical protein